MRLFKIVRIAGMHSKAAINSIYGQCSQLDLKTYAKQQEFLFSKRCMYGDAFSHEMRCLGHVAEEIVYDAELLQKTWMKEKGIPLKSQNWQEEILLTQLEHLKPDVVFFQDIHSLSHEILIALKQRIASIKKIVIFRGFPGVTERELKSLASADLLLVGSPILVDLCRKRGLTPHLVYHFFDSRVLNELENGKRLFDFTFIGSSGYGYGKGHCDRYWMLHDLLRKTPVELWIDEPGKELRKFWKKKVRGEMIFFLKKGVRCLPSSFLGVMSGKMSCYPRFKNLVEEQIELKKEKKRLPKKPLSEIFPERCRDPLFGLEMFQMLRQSRVVLNKHSNPAKDTIDNIRLFQATGVGSCLLTDSGRNIHDLFEEDREVVTYSSTDECIEKAKYLLKHEKERDSIAKAGQKRTLKDHSSKIRIEQINQLIQESL